MSHPSPLYAPMVWSRADPAIVPVEFYRVVS